METNYRERRTGSKVGGVTLAYAEKIFQYFFGNYWENSRKISDMAIEFKVQSRPWGP